MNFRITACKAQLLYTDFNETWCVVRVITLDVAYQILANYSKPLPRNRGMYLNL